MKIKDLKKDLKSLSNPSKKISFKRYFKAGKGQCAEGDCFLGITVPNCRKVAIKYKNLDLAIVEKLLKSKMHEERLTALLILIQKYEKGDDKAREKIYKTYIANTKFVNNWDLVDLSSHKIVGAHLFDKDRGILYKFSQSNNLWERGILIISCFYFIKNSDFNDALKISKILLKDEHDLIHKAVGWMLREISKKDLKKEEYYLKSTTRKCHEQCFAMRLKNFQKQNEKLIL